MLEQDDYLDDEDMELPFDWLLEKSCLHYKVLTNEKMLYKKCSIAAKSILAAIFLTTDWRNAQNALEKQWMKLRIKYRFIFCGSQW